MQKFEHNLLANTSGGARPLAGVSIAVTDKSTGLPAALYSDNGVTPLAQPLTTDSDGYFGFHAADGKYVLTFSGLRITTFTREIVLEDPADNPYAPLTALAAPTGASLIGAGNRTVENALTIWTLKTEDYTAVAGDKLMCDTTASPITITLPADPAPGAFVQIKAGPAAATKKLTVGRNGNTIMGLAEDMEVTDNHQDFTLVYDGATWRL